jgi:sugar O-acyltransferase (sialic acid O-acetyltransferase NeuD family)
LVILGAGGHGQVAADCAETMNVFSSIVFLDEVYPDKTQAGCWPILGKGESVTKFDKQTSCFFVAIGDNSTRQKVLQALIQDNFQVISLIHPTAFVSAHARIENGVLVCANATINHNAVVGFGSIINTAASIDHDCVIGNYVHVSVGSRLAGAITVDDRSFLGINSCVIQGVKIGKDCILGAGATLIKDLPSNTTAVGTPAKVIKKHD